MKLYKLTKKVMLQEILREIVEQQSKTCHFLLKNIIFPEVLKINTIIQDTQHLLMNLTGTVTCMKILYWLTLM